MLPNFLCIGAQKSGTTTVAHVLEQHPDVFMAQPRETRFFVDPSRFAMGVQNYEIESFGGWSGQLAAGEKTPEYLLLDETAARVRDVLGDALRVIVCVRNPARRAFSHFRHNLGMRVETLPFHDALDQEEARIGEGAPQLALFGYRHRGRYARRLEPWLAAFPRERILVLKFESDVAGPGAERLPHRLFEFLGVPPLAAAVVPRLGRPEPARWSSSPEGVEITAGGSSVCVRSPSALLVDVARRAEAARLSSETLSAVEAASLNDRLWRDDILQLTRSTSLDVADWLA